MTAMEELLREIERQKPNLPSAVHELLRHHSAADIISAVLFQAERDAASAESEHLKKSKALADAKAAAKKGLT